MLCMMKSKISARSGSSRFRRSVYTSPATLNSLRVAGVRRKCRATPAGRLRVETCVVSPPLSGIFGCARYSRTWSLGVWQTVVWAPPVCTPRDTISSITPDNLLAGCSFHAEPYRRGRKLAVAVSRWHCSATYFGGEQLRPPPPRDPRHVT